LETIGGGISAPSGGANPWAARAAEVACPACASREGLTPDPHTPLEEFAPDQHEPPNKTIAGAEGGGWRESRAALDVRVGRLRHKDAGLRVIVLNGWRTDTVGRLTWALFIFSYISFWLFVFVFFFFFPPLRGERCIVPVCQNHLIFYGMVAEPKYIVCIFV
jgi:hypothetical protein